MFFFLKFRLSQQFESTKINWMRVLKKDCDFRVGEDKRIFRCEFLQSTTYLVMSQD